MFCIVNITQDKNVNLINYWCVYLIILSFLKILDLL